jgi:hypothetical protein
MEHKSGCVVCGGELVYTEEPKELQCVFCRGVFRTQAMCRDNHFVCDACHSLGAGDLIERLTVGSLSTDPVEMALTLMKNPALKMHGPEHHFLVPAVLVSAFCTASRRPEDEKERRIKKARERAGHVLGGFCGFYGDCGAAVGTGIFVSVVTDATPLSIKEWRLANLVTAQSLYVIANAGGPRCCKRNSFLAIEEAVRFAKNELGVAMEGAPRRLSCTFYPLNKECIKELCPFHPKEGGVGYPPQGRF